MQFRAVDATSIFVPPMSKHFNAKLVEKQREYNDFLTNTPDGMVGELEVSPPETLRGVKVSLRRASNRLGKNFVIWSNGVDKVWFKFTNSKAKTLTYA